VKVLLGIGNDWRGDDGVGPYIARSFHEEGWLSIDSGTTPENFTSILRRECPEVVVIVDAADMGLSPGSFRQIPMDRIADVSIGTHGPSLTAFLVYLSSFIRRVVFIGIQPQKIQDSHSLTSSVRQGAESLKKVLKEQGISGIESFQENPATE
jgi:hydrogenase 3 maturation protease